MYAKLFKDLNEEDYKSVIGSSVYNQSLNFRHYPIINQYYDEYHQGAYQDCSLIIYENKQPLMLVFAFCKENHFSYFDLPIQIYVDSNLNQEILSNLYHFFCSFFKKYLQENKFSSLIYANNNFLTSFFFQNISSVQLQYESYVDLNTSEEIIKRNIRKSYKSLVNWGKRELDCKLYNSKNITEEVFYSFKDFHFRVSGRKTRSDKSWDIQLDTIKENHAYLVLSYHKGKLVSGNFINHGLKNAEYGVGVYDRDLMAEKLPLAHYPLLISMYHAKSIGIQKFVLGAISDSEMELKKLLDIYKFKKGFSSTISTNNITKINL